MALRNESIVAAIIVAALTGCATSSQSHQEQPRDVASENSSSNSQQGVPPFAAGLPMPMTGTGMPDGAVGLPVTTSGQEDPRPVGLPVVSSGGMPPGAVGLPVRQDPTAVNLSCRTEKKTGGIHFQAHLLLDSYSPEINIELEATNGAKAKRLNDIVSRILRPTDDSYLFVNKAAGFVMFLSGHLTDKSFPGHMNMIVDGKRISKPVHCKAWKDKSK